MLLGKYIKYFCTLVRKVLFFLPQIWSILDTQKKTAFLNYVKTPSKKEKAINTDTIIQDDSSSI